MQLTSYMGQPDPDSALQNLNEDVLNGYIKWLRNRGNSTGTQRLRITHVKRWSRSNGLKIEWDNVVLPKGRPVVSDRAPTKTELRLIMSYSPIWIIPTILILVSSGMRIGGLIRLRLKHLNLDSFPDIAILEVPPEAAKGGIGYFTCITPEAREAVKKHFSQREKNGEKLGPESPLIKAPMADGNTTYDSVAQAWRRCLRRAGLDEKSRGTYVLHLHTLRKFFRSQVEGILTKSIREALMGHVSGEYLDRNYLRIPEQKMAEWYRKAVPALTVYEDVQSEEYQRKQLLRQAALLLPAHKLEMLKNIMENESNLDEVVREYQKMTLQPNNGTYEIVTGEEEMLRLLSEGYELEKELNGDKYLLKKG
jgi:integrase